jgi:ribosome-associated protein
MAAHDESDLYEDEGPSKSQRKREAEDLKDLGDQLVRLPQAELDALQLPEKLFDAVELARRITAHGGAARQRQLIGKILRHIDVAGIRAAIEAQELDRRLAAREFHRIETWRDRLLTEGEPAVAALLATAPALDAKRLRGLVDTARHEATLARPPAAARELFRWLREALADADPSA